MVYWNEPDGHQWESAHSELRAADDVILSLIL